MNAKLPWDNTDERWVEIGVMDEDPHVLELVGYDRASRYAGVILVGDSYVQCRVANFRGIFDSPKKGDQVLVLFPGARTNSGVVVAVLHSEARPFPLDGDTDKTAVINPKGFKVVVSGAPVAEPPEGDATFVVDEGSFVQHLVSVGSLPEAPLRADMFLSDLQASLTEIAAALLALGAPTPNTAALLAKITTSLTTVNLPYRSRNVKVD